MHALYKLALVGLFVGLLALASKTAHADAILYGTTGSGGTSSTLYTVDKTTGITTFVGDVGFAINSMAYYDGTLYGTERQGGDLITINTATGAGTAVGPLGTTITSIAIDATGTAFGWSESGDALHSLNLATGAATYIGDPGIFTATHGMDFIGSTLYLHNGGTETIYTVNTATGALTSVGSTGLFDRDGHGGSVSPDDGLYYGLNWTNSNSTPTLYRSSLSTATPLGSVDTDRQLHSLAFASSPVPEPGSIALLGLGLAGLALGARRRRKA